MGEMGIERRTILAGGLALAAVSATESSLGAAEATAAPAAFAPAPLPLPFKPESLGWLSQKLIVSHHENNYAGAVKRLGQIQSQFAAIDPLTAPGFIINGMKR